MRNGLCRLRRRSRVQHVGWEVRLPCWISVRPTSLSASPSGLVTGDGPQPRGPTTITRIDRGSLASESFGMADRQFKILIDGECPLCKQEGDFLRWLDGGRRRLAIEDITTPDFDPGKYGKTMDELMGQIHGVTHHGTVVSGMTVFRRAYEAVGWGWLLAPTNWPILRWASDACYAWFARNRLRLTGRKGTCDSGRCRTV